MKHLIKRWFIDSNVEWQKGQIGSKFNPLCSKLAQVAKVLWQIWQTKTFNLGMISSFQIEANSKDFEYLREYHVLSILQVVVKEPLFDKPQLKGSSVSWGGIGILLIRLQISVAKFLMRSYEVNMTSMSWTSWSSRWGISRMFSCPHHHAKTSWNVHSQLSNEFLCERVLDFEISTFKPKNH